ncbi:MAG: type II secretion system protein M [Oscillibacter sp.]|nr:type II secretion system protein M [Oscillibacter sp.]
MKILSRDFTVWEKLVLLVLVIALMALGYYRLIDQPVRQGIEEAHAQRDKLQADLADVNRRISDYETRVAELDEARELRQFMPSYNGSEEELQILNGILSASDNYSLNVEKITLEGNQIRRKFSFSFSVPDFESVRGIFARLSASRVRCLIGNVDCSGLSKNADGTSISVRADGAFYETLSDATSDVALEELLRAQNRTLP